MRTKLANSPRVSVAQRVGAKGLPELAWAAWPKAGVTPPGSRLTSSHIPVVQGQPQLASPLGMEGMGTESSLTAHLAEAMCKHKPFLLSRTVPVYTLGNCRAGS